MVALGLGLGGWGPGAGLPPAAAPARAWPSLPARAALAEGPGDLLGVRPGISPDCATLKCFLNLRASWFLSVKRENTCLTGLNELVVELFALMLSL